MNVRFLAQSGHTGLRWTRPLSGVKRTCASALQMSAFDQNGRAMLRLGQVNVARWARHYRLELAHVNKLIVIRRVLR